MDETTIEPYQTKQPPNLWKWYFGWHPRIFVTVPTFLLFVYSGLWFIWAEISDIVFFFQHTEITWRSIFVVFVLGNMVLWLIILPTYICFWSIEWLYQINVVNYTAWKKFLYSIGIILLVIFGTSAIRIFTAWIMGIL